MMLGSYLANFLFYLFPNARSFPPPRCVPTLPLAIGTPLVLSSVVAGPRVFHFFRSLVGLHHVGTRCSARTTSCEQLMLIAPCFTFIYTSYVSCTPPHVHRQTHTQGLRIRTLCSSLSLSTGLIMASPTLISSGLLSHILPLLAIYVTFHFTIAHRGAGGQGASITIKSKKNLSHFIASNRWTLM